MNGQARFRNRFRAAIVVAALVALSAADHAGLLLSPRTSDMARYHRAEATLTRALSPAMIEVDLPDELRGSEATQVVLWGVTAPDAAGETEGAFDAALELVDAWRGRTVRLTLERQRMRDPFGRVLAHVELPEGGTLNELLLEAGLATADERRPHAMLTRYAQAQNNARRRGRGLWKR